MRSSAHLNTVSVLIAIGFQPRPPTNCPIGMASNLLASLLLVATPGAPSSVRSLLVAMASNKLSNTMIFSFASGTKESRGARSVGLPVLLLKLDEKRSNQTVSVERLHKKCSDFAMRYCSKGNNLLCKSTPPKPRRRAPPRSMRRTPPTSITDRQNLRTLCSDGLQRSRTVVYCCCTVSVHGFLAFPIVFPDVLRGLNVQNVESLDLHTVLRKERS